MGPDDWRVDSASGLRLVRCGALSRIPGIAHAFSTRLDGDNAEFDLGSHDDDDARTEARRRALCHAAGLPGQLPTVLHQVHGARVLLLDEADSRPGRQRADGVVARRSERPLAAAVRTADCVPLLLAAGDGSAAAAIHAGWRGTAAGVVPRAVSRMRELGVKPAEVIAAVGPAIGGCCYEVGREVITAVSRATGRPAGALTEGDSRLDLGRAVRLQLEREGLRPRSIHVAPWCTRCESEMFHSYRRQGPAAGRQMALVGWSGMP